MTGWLVLRTLGALALVLGLLGGALWAVRRFDLKLPGGLKQLRKAGGRRIELVERMALDARRMLTLVRVDGVEHLILLTPETSVLIASRDAPAAVPGDAIAQGGQSWQDVLAEAVTRLAAGDGPSASPVPVPVPAAIAAIDAEIDLRGVIETPPPAPRRAAKPRRKKTAAAPAPAVTARPAARVQQKKAKAPAKTASRPQAKAATKAPAKASARPVASASPASAKAAAGTGPSKARVPAAKPAAPRRPSRART